jgi:hypothetical protein
MPDDPDAPPATKASRTDQRSASNRFTTTDIGFGCLLSAVLGPLLMLAAILIVGLERDGAG